MNPGDAFFITLRWQKSPHAVTESVEFWNGGGDFYRETMTVDDDGYPTFNVANEGVAAEWVYWRVLSEHADGRSIRSEDWLVIAAFDRTQVHISLAVRDTETGLPIADADITTPDSLRCHADTSYGVDEAGLFAETFYYQEGLVDKSDSITVNAAGYQPITVPFTYEDGDSIGLTAELTLQSTSSTTTTSSTSTTEGD